MAKQSKKKTRGKQKAPTPPPSRWAAHRPLFERTYHAVAQFVFIEGLAGIVVLDKSRHNELGGFESRKSLVAIETLTAAADLPTLASQA